MKKEFDVVHELDELVQLHRDTALSDEEFALAKARLISESHMSGDTDGENDLRKLATGEPTETSRTSAESSAAPSGDDSAVPVSLQSATPQLPSAIARPAIVGTASSKTRKYEIMAAILVVAMMGLVATLVLINGRPAGSGSRGSDSAIEQTEQTSASTVAWPPAPVVRAASAVASCTSPPSRDSAGNPVTYDPSNLLDGQLDTAWRCDGNGDNQQVVVDFGGARTVRTLGLVPGYAKVDSTDGTDRFIQDRRISAVRYTFDDGSSATQYFDTDNRSMQVINVSPRVTGRVAITILSSIDGAPINGQDPVNKIAISDATFS